MSNDKVELQSMDREVLFQFTWADYAVFGTMLAVSSIIGLFFGFKDYRKSRNQPVNEATSDANMLNYLVGGRKMAIFPVGCSLVATWTSAIALFGTTGETYMFGGEYLLFLTGIVFLGFVST
jgi:solute carrier family 5 (sodium-coupled monocarboxylate transporter), member 8/12